MNEQKPEAASEGSIGQSASTAGLEQQSDLEVVIHYEGDAYNRPLGRGLLLGTDYLEDMIPDGDCHVSVTVYRRRSNNVVQGREPALSAKRPSGTDGSA